MKKITLCAALILVAAGVFAQSDSAMTTSGRIFKPFKVDVSAGFALPLGGNGSKGGALFAVEPKYAIMDKFAIGLRLEIAALARVTNADPNNTAGDAQGNGSYLLTGDYYFSNQKFRPFFGAGGGVYSVAAASFDTPDDVKTATKSGFMIRGGFETGHFRFGIEYNIVGQTDFSANNDYIGFKVGGFFGGGRK
jgi:hypothetical protein